MAKFTLLIPTLNEIDGMRVIMPRIQPGWYDQMIIADGGSTDGTIEYAREHGYPLFVQDQPGVRYAYLEAMKQVEGDYLITFSPDGNSIPELIPQMRDKILEEDADMVIASRYLGDAKSEDDDALTGFGNWFFTKSVNVLFGGSYTDVMVILRAYRLSLVRELGLDQDELYGKLETWLGCRGLSWEPLLSARAARRKLKVMEIPGDEPPRIGGERKLLPFRWGSTIYTKFLLDSLFWR